MTEDDRGFDRESTRRLITQPPNTHACPVCGEESEYGSHRGGYNTVVWICDKCGYEYTEPGDRDRPHTHLDQ